MLGKKKVTILGAGPSGLLAAHACEERGWEVQIYSAPGSDYLAKKSELHGCQYLHGYIPGTVLGTAGKAVRYLLEGSSEDYRRKVYGDNWSGEVSPDEYGPEKTHFAWDLRAVYDEMWERWQSRISPINVTPKMASEAARVRHQIVLSTVPAPALCLKPEEHKFVSQTVWAMGSVTDPTKAQWRLPYYAPDMTVQCNGNDGPRWYRAATVFGASTIEWPQGPKPPINGVKAVSKPLSTNCDCHVKPGRWHRLGRYGKWQKGVLVHEAYGEVFTL